MNKELIRKLPKVDEILSHPQIAQLDSHIPHKIILDAVRSVIDRKRNMILSGSDCLTEDEICCEALAEEVCHAVDFAVKPNLTPVINATGVTLHTNLGRARLSASATEAVSRSAKRYSNLEYNLDEGKRGSRHDHVEKIIREITGAESAMVVNNNAAATMLCMSAMGFGHEIIVSRGELVEIGGSFRIPDIMRQSGATLREVGTTNKTHLSDYENNINEETSALMKVHTSNYRIMGFTEDVSLEELVALGKKHELPVIYDMGSGLMVSLADYGVDEPTVIDSLNTGIDVILFSGDKLLGGPQGGIIAGRKKYIDLMKKHPLARVLRVDKMTLSAMEATFREYYDTEQAKKNIPVLATICKSDEELKASAEYLKSQILNYCGESNMEIKIEPVSDQVGGGSAPTVLLSGLAVSVRTEAKSCQEIEELLRKGSSHIIVRIAHDKVYFDVRTMSEEDMRETAERLSEIISE